MRIAWSSLIAVMTGQWLATSAGLRQDVYVWQRAWTEPARQAVAEHGAAFTQVVVLKAEVTWKAGQPQAVQVPVDYQALAQLKRSIGIALRIGPYSGSFDKTNSAARYLADLAQKLVFETKAAGIEPAELQLDFDCAASRLEGYRAWVEIVRQRVRPTPLTITALPAWLDRDGFKALAQATDGYVLQVHSLERPRSFDATFTLCDPSAAKRAVAKGSAIGVPFRVALPTYGYVLAFGSHGDFLSLSAEGPQKRWPSDARLREVRADPLEMGRLVHEWSPNPPVWLQGIIWYRLPVQGDILNWRWPTLSAIVQARIPRKSVRAKSHRVEAGLTEISLVNDGELDISSRLAVQTRWRGARLLAGDGLCGFELAGREISSARFETGMQSHRLAAGDEQVIGWLRLTEDREVEIELEELAGR
jgi:hypothetical protein